MDRGNSFYKEEAYEKARDAYLEVLSETDSLTGLARHKIGLTFYKEGNHPAAAEAYREAISVRDAVLPPGSLDAARSRRNLGAALINSGGYEEAGKVLREALSTYATANPTDTVNWLRSLMDLSQLAHTQRDYQLAISSAAGVRDLLRRVSLSSYDEQQANYIVAHTYESFGRAEDALPFARRALELSQEDGYYEEILTNLNLVSVVYAKLDRHEDQIAVAKQALSLAEGLPEAEALDVGLLHINMARSYGKLNRIGEARLQADYALELLKDSRPAWLPMIHGTRGNLALLAEDNFDALAAFNAGLAAFHPVTPGSYPRPHPDSLSKEDMEEATILLGNRAKLLGRSDRALEAFSDYELLFTIQDRLRGDLDLESSYSFLSIELRQYYDEAVDLLVNHAEAVGDDTYLWDAFSLTERAKAYSLLRALQQDRRQRGEREITLRARIAQLQRLAAGDERYEPALEAANLQLDRLLHQRRKASLTDVEEPMGKEVVALLKEQKKVLLTYHLGDNNGYLFLIDPDSSGIQYFPIPEVARLGERIESWQDALRRSAYRRKSMLTDSEQADLDQAFVNDGYALYRQLLGAASVVDQNIIIIPDGPLSVLPFSGLITEKVEGAVDYATLPYFQGERAIAYAYSARILKELSQRGTTDYEMDLLAFAPSFSNTTESPLAQGSRKGERALPGLSALRYNEAEVEGIARVFPNHELYKGVEANRENFFAAAGRARIVHLSTHGMVNAADPELSFVAFTQVGDSLELEEMLYYNDLSAMDLQAELAVLSACETSLGRYLPGEHTFSLASAFASAGARSTLTTLWQVDDEATQEVMEGFYQSLSHGFTRDVALMRAQRGVKESRNFAHPYYWAGFTLYGNTGKLLPAPVGQKWRVWALIGFGLLLVAAVVYSFRRKRQSI